MQKMEVTDETRERLDKAPAWIKQFADGATQKVEPLMSRQKQVQQEYTATSLLDNRKESKGHSYTLHTVLLSFLLVCAFVALALSILQMQKLKVIQATFKDMLVKALDTGKGLRNLSELGL